MRQPKIDRLLTLRRDVEAMHGVMTLVSGMMAEESWELIAAHATRVHLS